LAQTVEEEGLRSPSVIVVGDVVRGVAAVGDLAGGLTSDVADDLANGLARGLALRRAG
jgi:siroheme synthase